MFAYISVLLAVIATVTESMIVVNEEYTKLGYGTPNSWPKKDATTQVIGEPEIRFCSTAESLQYFAIKSYDFSPKDLHAGVNLTLSLDTVLKKKVTSGKIVFEVTAGKYHLPMISGELDLCTETEKEGGVMCPLLPQEYKFSQTFPIPDLKVHGKFIGKVTIIGVSEGIESEMLCVEIIITI